ncbi:MAG: prephenate dehydrogenase [Candidatus Saccharibacteria bacterium]|nr:prephenate dehydrogenase [Candidatus Saccharibacteria bacterium]
MSNFMKTVGIIGFGSFGKFLAEQLDRHAEVRVFSYSGKPNGWKASLEDVACSDYVILAVPLESYESVLTDLRPNIPPSTILVDVCSVKQKPIEVIRKLLPKQLLAATHPLFGPQTADSLAGEVLVVCPEVSDKKAMKEIESLAVQFKLKITRMSAEEHDREIAVVQGLAFFIARILKDNKLHEQKLSTPSFRRLLHLAELEEHHSDELFYTIQSGNRFTSEIRRAFIDEALRLQDEIRVQTEK